MTELATITYRGANGEHRTCPHVEFLRVRTCKRRDCPRCGRTWARAWGACSFHNLEHYNGPVALVSITAPGADVLPWSCGRDHKHSGPRGCRVKADAADVWASNVTANWSALRDAARRAVARAGHEPPPILERVWEPQKRGVPHLHIVLGVATHAEREAARCYVDELARLAPAYLFGFVDRKLAPIHARDASRYLTNYLLGRSSSKSTIRENIADPRMPRSLVWITPRLTSATKVTMRNLRRARWVLASLAGNCLVHPSIRPEDSYDVAAACVALDRVRVLRSARGPDEPRELTEGRARLAYVRAMQAMRGRYAGALSPVAA